MSGRNIRLSRIHPTSGFLAVDGALETINQFGIGSDFPGANLHVEGNVYASSNLEVGQANLFVDTTSSRVGVATRDPDATLHVEGNVYASSNLEVGQANLFVDTTSSRVGVGRTDPNFTLDVNGDINFSGQFYQGGSPFVSTPWTIETNPDALSYTAGNVGIGASNPSANLHVTGNAYVSSNLEIGQANLFVDTTTTRVGIGTEAPNATLHVEGDAYVSSDINIKNVVTTQNAFGPVWAANATAYGFSYPKAVAVDSDANVYVVGQFRDSTLNVYSESETSPSVALSNDGNDDGFILKYNTSGEVLWATKNGGTGNDFPNTVAVDSDGNVYAAGQFSSSTLNIYNQGETSHSVTLSNEGSYDAFIIKYNTSGEVLWATKIGGSNSDDARAVAVDSDGNVYVVGVFSSSTLNIYSEGETSPSVTLSNDGSTDIYIVKYNTSGEVLLATKIGGSDSDSVRAVAVDSDGNVYVVGEFYNSTLNVYSEGETSPSVTLSNDGATDIYIVKYNTSLEVLWATKIGGSDSEYVNGLAVDSDANVYVAGQFRGSTLDVYNQGETSPSVTLNNGAPGTYDGYIIKYNTSGEVLWATKIGGSGYEYVNGLAVDSDANVYVTGRHQGMTLNSEDGSGITKTLSYFQQGFDSFVAKYSTSGRVLWAATITGKSNQTTYGVAPDSDGNIYVVGVYEGISTLYNEDQFDTSKNLPGNGDIFIAKYGNISKVNVISPDTALNVNNDIKISGEITGPGRRMFKTYRGTLTTPIALSGSVKYVRTGVFLGEGFYIYRCSIVGRGTVNANRSYIRRGLVAMEDSSTYYQDSDALGFARRPNGVMRLNVLVEEYSSKLGEFVIYDDPSVDTPTGTYDWEISIDEYQPFY